MFKKFFIILCCLSILFILGCGEKYEGPPADLVIKNAKVVTIDNINHSALFDIITRHRVVGKYTGLHVAIRIDVKITAATGKADTLTTKVPIIPEITHHISLLTQSPDEPPPLIGLFRSWHQFQ